MPLLSVSTPGSQLLGSAANKKLIILDPSLKNTGGHYYEYDASIGAAATHRGIQTRIYAHKSYDTSLGMPDGEISPWFSTEWTAGGGSTKALARFLLRRLPVALRIPLGRSSRRVWSLLNKQPKKKATGPRTSKLSAAAETFGMEVMGALRDAGCTSEDLIFVPTIRTSELFALWKCVESAFGELSLQYHIVLRRDAAEMDLPEGGAPGISQLFKEMNAALAGKAFHFYCDTQQLCGDYTSLSGYRLEFRLLPIPVPSIGPDPISLEKWSAGPELKLVYLGGARVEKGFHLLSLAEQFMRKTYTGKIIWRLQAPNSGDLEEPDVILARRYLSSVRDGSVELVQRNLTSSEFQSLLLSADVVLLPYLPEFYRARSSGILVQVLAAGKPVIVPANTWLSSQTNGLGAVEFEGSQDFPKALLTAVQQLSRLTSEAQERAADFAALHSADALLRELERWAHLDRDQQDTKRISE